MGAGASTFIVLAAWATPIVIGILFMAMQYRSPPAEELAQYDQVQPEEVAPTPEALANRV